MRLRATWEAMPKEAPPLGPVYPFEPGGQPPQKRDLGDLSREELVLYLTLRRGLPVDWSGAYDPSTGTFVPGHLPPAPLIFLPPVVPAPGLAGPSLCPAGAAPAGAVGPA